MLSEKEIFELEAQLEAMKKRVAYAEKRAQKFEEKYKESESLNKEKDKIIAERDAEIKQISDEYKLLREQLLLSKKKMYGASVEKIAEGCEQLNFFNEAETERTPLLPEPKIKGITYTRKKKSKKKSFSEKYGDLPTEEIIVDIPEEERICKKCGEKMTIIRYEIRRELKIAPAKVSVAEYKIPVYVCRNCDKTPFEVLKHPKHNGPLNAYMWVYRMSVHEEPPVILYKYEIGKSGDFADKFLKGFKVYLHCDGWSGYDKVSNAKRCGCWAHLRRYFYNAFELQEDKNDFTTTAGQALVMIGRIFSAEKLDPKKPGESSSLSLEDVAEIRKETSTKLAEEFFKFCEKEYSKTLPKSVLGKAIGYALNQKEPLMRFLCDPRIELTNNAAERAVKPFVIGSTQINFAQSLLKSTRNQLNNLT